MIRTILCIAMFLVGASANAAGFDVGDELHPVELHGRVDLRCPGLGYNLVYCDAYYLKEGNTAKFVTDSQVDADKVKLVSYREDGSKKKKSKKYVPGKRSSKGQFNLWLSSLFQRPLLDYGTNRITYELKKDGDEVESGEFEVFVNDPEVRHCRTRSIAGSMVDCDNAGSASICNYYFRLEDACRY